MQGKSRLERLGALSGLGFAALLVSLRLIEGSGLPDPDAPTAKVVAYWTEHRSDQILIAVLASFAALCFVWFAGTLRSALRGAEGGNGTLTNISYGGGILAAAGMLAISTVEYAAADSAGHVPGQVTQTLSALQANTFLGLAAGLAIFGLAAGAVIVRTGVLSPKLGWLSIAAGVLWVSPGEFVAIFLTLIFVAVASVQLYRRGGEVRPAPEPVPAAGVS
jgi:hypothetical protein